MTNLVLLGSHALGVRCLKLLHEQEGIDIEAVVTYEAGYDGWWNGSVYDLAKQLGYPTLSIGDERSVLEYDVDYLLSVYYPNILGSELLEHPRQAAVNLHQAELPRYRGSNVFSHSIMNARKDDHWCHGTTLHVMTEQVDAGDIIDRRFVEITEVDTARSLYEKVNQKSVELFAAHLPHLVDRVIEDLATPQEEFEGKRYFYTKDSLAGLKRIRPEDLTDTGKQLKLYDRIRALDFPPFQPAYIELDGRKVYLTKAGDSFYAQ